VSGSIYICGMPSTYKYWSFIALALVILLSAAIIRWTRMEAWEKPSPCSCLAILSIDSTVSLPAAKALVGNGYYQYTLRVARMKCLSVYARQMPTAIWQDTLGYDWSQGRAYFNLLCP
jgi:hypothetical protein